MLSPLSYVCVKMSLTVLSLSDANIRRHNSSYICVKSPPKNRALPDVVKSKCTKLINPYLYNTIHLHLVLNLLYTVLPSLSKEHSIRNFADFSILKKQSIISRSTQFVSFLTINAQSSYCIF